MDGWNSGNNINSDNSIKKIKRKHLLERHRQNSVFIFQNIYEAFKNEKEKLEINTTKGKDLKKMEPNKIIETINKILGEKEHFK